MSRILRSTLIRIAAGAVLLVTLCARGDAQRADRPDEIGALRALYDDGAVFDQLSGPLRSRLEARFGRKDDAKSRPSPLPEIRGEARRAPDTVDAGAPIANIVVNNTAA